MRTARYLSAFALVMVFLSVAPRATAGGIETWALEGHPGEYEAVLIQGEHVEARAMLDLRRVRADPKGGEEYMAGPHQGPFYAYVTPQREGEGWGPYMPPMREGAVLVGEVVFTETSKARLLAMSFDFTVPSVEPGEYMLQVCNVPCTRQLGFIQSRPIVVVEDAGQAFLASQLQEHDFKLGRFTSVAHRLDNLRELADGLEAEVEDLKARLATLETRAEPASTPPAEPKPWSALVVVGLLAILISWGWRRQRVHPTEPVSFG